MSENKKEIEDAIFYYKIAVKNNPNLNNIWNNLAFMYQKTENHLEAKKILTKIIENEKIIITADAEKFVLSISNVSIRILINYLEKIKILNKNICINEKYVRVAIDTKISIET